MKQEATLSYAIFYLFLFLIMIFMFIVGTPFLLQVNETFTDVGINTMNTGLDFANKIQNTTVKNAMVTIFNDNINTTTNYEQTLDFWIQYSWMFVLILVTFIVIVFARKAEVMNEQTGVI
jgi:hypothetical protein